MSCASRNRTYSIMNHTGFGPIVIIKENIRVTVPEKCINITNGMIKKCVQARIECLNTKNIIDLNKIGVKCELNIMSKAE